MENSTITEVIDLENSDNVCENLQPFPFKNQQAGGALINEKYSLVCGGFRNDKSYGKGNKTENNQAKMIKQ